MEWTAVTVIIALVGLAAAIIKPIVSLTQAITRLGIVVERLEKDLEGFEERNRRAHLRIWDEIRSNEKAE